MNSFLFTLLTALILLNALYFAPVIAKQFRKSTTAYSEPFLWLYRLFTVPVIAATPIIGLFIAGIVAPDSELPFIAILFATLILMVLQVRSYDKVDPAVSTARQLEQHADQQPQSEERPVRHLSRPFAVTSQQ